MLSESQERVLRLPIQRIQDAVDRMVQADGRQPVLASTALLEATAAMHALGLDDSATGTALKQPLARFVLAGVRVASRFRVSLHQAFASASLSTDVNDLRAWTNAPVPVPALAHDVLKRVERVMETVDFYDGGAGVDPTAVTPLSALLPDLLVSAFAGFESAADLRAQLRWALAAAAGSASTGTEFDPSTGDALKLIAPIQQQTSCPFAAKARLWSAPSYDAEASFAANMRRSLPMLRAFLRVVRGDGLDGYVYAFPTRLFGCTDTDLARLFRAFLGFLVQHVERSTPYPLNREELLRPDWRLFIADEQFFVSAFAPFYRHDHSRFNFGAGDWFLFMLQPETSIHQFIAEDAYDARSLGIRQRFAETFQPYELAELEADRFVLPRRPGGSPVRWYDQDCTDPLVDAPT